jgi:hypothetical protein
LLESANGHVPGRFWRWASVEYIDGMTKFLARVAVAAFVGMIPVVLDAPDAIAKPHTPLDCVPVGVTKDHEGIVWADEDCDGVRVQWRMSPRGNTR